MQDTDHNDLKCTFEDAERNHLQDGMRMSTHDKIQSFEDMLDFAWHTGAIKTGRATDVSANEELRECERIRKETKPDG